MLIGTELMHVLTILSADDNTASGSAGLIQLGILLLIPLAMYFLMIRPQRRRMRAQQSMQSSLEVGDEVLTTSGIYGFITGFEDDKIWIEIDDDVQIRVNRGFVQGKVDATDATGRAPTTKAIDTTAVRRPPTSPATPRPRQQGMTRRRLWASLLGCVGITVVLLLLNLAFRNTPVLGLDLQGGVSVVLAPTEGANSDDLLVIRDLIRDELENRGIAEPDVRVEGSHLVVDLPGVKDQRDALDAVDVAGIVTLRPVLACTAPPAGRRQQRRSVPGSSVPRLVGPRRRRRPARTPAEHRRRGTARPPAGTPAGFGSPAGSSRAIAAPPTTDPGHDRRRRRRRRRSTGDSTRPRRHVRADHRAGRTGRAGHHRPAPDRRQPVRRRAGRRRR